jgi:hypothetical protein
MSEDGSGCVGEAPRSCRFVSFAVDLLEVEVRGGEVFFSTRRLAFPRTRAVSFSAAFEQRRFSLDIALSLSSSLLLCTLFPSLASFLSYHTVSCAPTATSTPLTQPHQLRHALSRHHRRCRLPFVHRSQDRGFRVRSCVALSTLRSLSFSKTLF